MKQRTLKNRTLAERSIYRGWDDKNPCEHVRAELQRVARRVRKLHTSEMNSEHSWAKGYSTALKDVLDLLKEAKR